MSASKFLFYSLLIMLNLKNDFGIPSSSYTVLSHPLGRQLGVCRSIATLNDVVVC